MVSPAIADDTIQTETGPVALQKLADLENPWGMAFTPDARLLITEKPGRVRIFANGVLSGPIGGVPEVVYGGQGGLLDIAVDPHFAVNRRVYLYFVEAAARQPRHPRDPVDPRLGDVSIEGVKMKGGAVMCAELGDTRLSWRSIIWRQSPKTLGRGQYGGRLVFAPDGTLFITGGDRQRFDVAQDMSSTIGKIVRIAPDGSIPEDNPFRHQRGVEPAVYSIGHRNALGAAIHPLTGALWETEMGPQGGDEVNVIAPGANYGWPVVSNGENYDGTPIPDHATRPEFKPPVVSWSPSIAPSGMAFYGGDLLAAWKDNLFLGGLASLSLWRLVLDGETVTHQERIPIGERVRDVIAAPDGTILILTDGPEGGLWRIAPVTFAAGLAPSTQP
ncbi:MAG: PQQ-dependent sugar dehydrogenase [Alphaproteobacteria bacterium]|nr:PQQ-dependent sugar dehydrogenase [Alphaproteobacteria bacterium]